MRVVEARYAMPGWGDGEIWLEGGVLLAHDFRFDALGSAARCETAENDPQGHSRVPSVTIAGTSSHVGQASVSTSHNSDERAAVALAERFCAFLGGGPDDFGDVAIDLEWATPLQRAIVEALRAVPRGEVVTYGELAALGGRPRAPRAAGAVCSSNRFAFIVPCHRVVSAGGIGGYGSTGVDVKRRLLALEGVHL